MCVAAVLAAAPATVEAQGPDPDPAPVSHGPRPDPVPVAPTTSAPATSAPAPVSSAPVAPVATVAPRAVTRAPVVRRRAATQPVARPAPRTAPTTTRRQAAPHHRAKKRSSAKPAATPSAPYPQRPYATESGVAVPNLPAPEPVERAGGGSADTRLILQLGMLFSLVYVAFLCVWFRATRHLRADGAGSAFALARRRVRAWWEHAFAGSGRPPGRRTAGRRDGPTPGEADGQWTCEIAYQPGQLRFQAVMAPDETAGQQGTDTKVLHWPRGVPKPSARELESAMGALFASIAAAGWEPVGSGGVWSERRYVWRKAGEPPTSFELVGAGIHAGAARPARPRAPRGANREAVLRTVAARPGLTLRELTEATGVRPSSLPPLVRTLTLRGELEKLRLPDGQTGYALARPIQQSAEADKELQPAP
jgi:hypothetical protein